MSDATNGPQQPRDVGSAHPPRGPADDPPDVSGDEPVGVSGDEDAGLGDGVALRTLLVGELPLLVAAVGESGRGPRLHAALVEAGLAQLPAFLGHDLAKGARVGFQLDASELQLKNEQDDTLLRAARSGLDEGWLAGAGRLKGTMTVVVHGPAPDLELPPAQLVTTVDSCAREGRAIGAIVGVVEERPSLPLIF